MILCKVQDNHKQKYTDWAVYLLSRIKTIPVAVTTKQQRNRLAKTEIGGSFLDFSIKTRKSGWHRCILDILTVLFSLLNLVTDYAAGPV
jgi:hypothetical protein